ncbi:MAG: tetratricopeptide repeat protein [Planctomycetota bacterium]
MRRIHSDEGFDDMFWTSSHATLPKAWSIRVIEGVMRFTLLSTTFIIGLSFFPAGSGPYVIPYWSVWGGTALYIVLGPLVRSLAERWRFQRLVKNAFADEHQDRSAMITASAAIVRGEELRALDILQRLPTIDAKNPGAPARLWLSALAGVHWIARQSPFETLPQKVERYPTIHALMHCHTMLRAPLRMKALDTELERISSTELDAYARAHIALIDALISALNDPASPFASQAPELLAALTGRSHLLNAHERFSAWWKDMRPVYVRGGGALLAGLRLTQRSAYAEAARLLERLSQDGMLSYEADTVRRATRFLALFAAPSWHITSADIPRYFAEGMYHQWGEMGVFRFPTADLSEVIACCKRGRIYRDAKRRLIDDTLDLWDRFGDDLSEPLSLLLRRVLEERGRHPSARADFWRLKWDMRKKGFDKNVELLMDGIVRASRRDWAGAIKAFHAAAALDTTSSLPHVNIACVMLKCGRRDEARTIIEQIQVLYPKDGYALISLGRLLAIHAQDAPEAEKLFLKALGLVSPPTEALSCLGEIKMLAGEFAESQFYFEQARQLDPGQPGPKLGLARVFVETRRFDDAIGVLKEVARDGPGEARDVAYYMLYRTHRESGEDRESLKYLEMIPARFFNDPDTIDDIAVHLESEKMYAKAREFAERAMLLRATGHTSNDDPNGNLV